MKAIVLAFAFLLGFTLAKPSRNILSPHPDQIRNDYGKGKLVIINLTSGVFKDVNRGSKLIKIHLTPGVIENTSSNTPVPSFDSSSFGNNSTNTNPTEAPIDSEPTDDTTGHNSGSSKSNLQNTTKQVNTQVNPLNCDYNEIAVREIWSKINSNANKINALEESIPPLKEKIKTLTETIEELIDTTNVGTKLLLVGNRPAQTNPVEDVRHILVEKLDLMDLSTSIVQAMYVNDGIDFEVKSSIDKLRILKRSKNTLFEESYKIIDPKARERNDKNDQRDDKPGRSDNSEEVPLDINARMSSK